jgi:hypothetical protein
MDGHRLDAVTRQLAAGMRRRDALKTLVGIALAGVAARAAGSRVAADGGNTVGDYCDDKNPCNKDKGLVCVNRECEKKKDHAKKHGKKGKKKHHHTDDPPPPPPPAECIACVSGSCVGDLLVCSSYGCCVGVPS